MTIFIMFPGEIKFTDLSRRTLEDLYALIGPEHVGIIKQKIQEEIGAHAKTVVISHIYYIMDDKFVSVHFTYYKDRRRRVL